MQERRFLLPALFIGVSVFGVIAACVGDEPNHTSPPGGDSGAHTDANATLDSGGPTDGGTEPSCDPSKAFGAPVPVPSLNTTEYLEADPWLSRDGRTIYFTRSLPGGPVHIWIATRATPDGDFTNVRPLDELVTDQAMESSPSVTSDGLYIYYTANPPDGGDHDWDLYGATRENVDASFGPPVRLTFSTSQYGELSPVVGPDNALYFSVYGEPTSGSDWDGSTRSTAPIFSRALVASSRRRLTSPATTQPRPS